MTPAAPREVLLHLGHNKTASSFLQSALANSVAILAGQGIHYPLNPRNAEAALAGEITGGNIGPDATALERVLEHDWSGSANRLLLSSEGLFNTLSAPAKGLRFLAMLRDRLPGCPVRVMLYIRDPLGHAVSHYHQLVKRNGISGDFANFVDTYAAPQKVRRVLSLLHDAGVAVTVVNYSRHRDRIMERFEIWLGLEPGTLAVPPVGRVNRSLTLAELELQRLFNIGLGKKAGRFISAPLCAGLPDIRSQVPHLPADGLARFLDRMRRMTDAATATGLVPEDEAWQVESDDEAGRIITPPPADMRYSFSPAQIDLLVRSISKQIRRGDST
jgi:hypothetical protein